MKRFSLIYLLLVFSYGRISADDLLDSLKLRLSVEKDPIQKCRILSELSDNAPEGEWQKYNDELGVFTRKLLKNKNFENDSILIHCMAIYFNNKGFSFGQNTDYVNSINCFDSAKQALLIIGDKKELSLNRSNLGVLYERVGETDAAIESYKEAFELQKEEPVSIYTVMILNNLGKSFLNLSDTVSATDCFSKALGVVKEIGLQDQTSSIVHWNIGRLLYSDGNLDSAASHFIQGAKEVIESGDPKPLALNLAGLADIAFQNGDFNISRKLLDSSYVLLKPTKNYYELMSVAETRSIVLKDMGLYQQSLESYEAFVLARDSVNKDRNIKSLLSYQIKTELESQERLRKEAEELEQIQTENNRRKQFLGIFSFIIFLFTSFVVLRRSRLSLRLVDNVGFVGILLFFQFIEVVINPYVDQYSYGNPVFFMAINITMAAMIKPLHDFMERKVFQGKRRDQFDSKSMEAR